jgi:hypothetical protein
LCYYIVMVATHLSDLSQILFSFPALLLLSLLHLLFSFISRCLIQVSNKLVASILNYFIERWLICQLSCCQWLLKPRKTVTSAMTAMMTVNTMAMMIATMMATTTTVIIPCLPSRRFEIRIDGAEPPRKRMRRTLMDAETAAISSFTRRYLVPARNDPDKNLATSIALRQKFPLQF